MAFLPPGNSADWSTLDIEFLSASCALTVARQNAEKISKISSFFILFRFIIRLQIAKVGKII